MSGADGEHDAGGSVTDSTATLVNEHLLEPNQTTNHSRVLLNSSGMLCARCDSLNLSVDHFIVQSLPKQETTRPKNFRLRSTTAPINLGTLQEIVNGSKAGCKFCNLLCSSVQNKQGHPDPTLTTSPEVLSAMCSLGWEVDGRKMFEDRYSSQILGERRQAPRGLTRRIHAKWNNTTLQDLYLVFVASQHSVTASDAERVWNPNYLFLGRKIGARGNIQARVKSWIDLCQQKHRGPCITPHWGEMSQNHFRKMISSSYFGVIDVVNMQLTQLPSQIPHDDLSAPQTYGLPEQDVPPYVALSYVWGDTQACRTLKENVMSRRTHGGLDQAFSTLPKVIKDAIELVRRLGFRFLWIDSLCIIQDSERSWSQNAFDMDLIYGNAIFTICAADGTASTGLEAMHESTGTGSGDQTMAYCTKDVQLVVTRPPEIYIKGSKWNTRAWTFQERLLSRRCLIFTGNRVYFQCRSTGMSEDIFTDREGAGWSLDFTDAPLQIFRQLPLRSMWVYMRMVELYTARQLSEEEDILAAFGGVLNVMKQTMNAAFVSGLPSSHLDLALLWEHPERVQRRSSKTTAVFPSWSWCGWTGAAAQYQRNTLDGCLDDVKEWLGRRTWIRWYIRDCNGELRPLWDPDQWDVDASDHDNWQGYGPFRSSGTMLLNRHQPERRASTYVHANSDYSQYSMPSEMTDVDLPRPWQPSPIRAPRCSRSASVSVTLSPDKQSHSHANTVTRSYGPLPALGLASKGDGGLALAMGNDKAQITNRSIETGDKPSTANPCLSHDASKPKINVSRYRILSEAKSTISSGVSWIYRNEFGRFFVDVLSALIRLALVLLGFRIPSDTSPILAPYTNESLRESSRYTNRADVLVPKHEDHEHTNETGNTTEHEIVHVREHVKHVSPKTSSPFSDAQPEIRPPIIQEIITHYHNIDHGVEYVPAAPEHSPPPSLAYRKSKNKRHTSKQMSTIVEHLEPDPRDIKLTSADDSIPKKSTYADGRSSSRLDLGAASSFTALERRGHDMIFQPDHKVTPEDTESRPSFQVALKEFPYPPVIAPYDSVYIGSKTMSILQFWTYHTYLHIQCPPDAAEEHPGLVRCNIADNFGDWCGTIVLDEHWIDMTKTARHEFIALSESKKFTNKECQTWSYYVPKEREESEWDLFYVMLIVWKNGRWERRGIGKVFKEAFRDATWKEIVLA